MSHVAAAPPAGPVPFARENSIRQAPRSLKIGGLPAAEIETVFLLNRIRFEHREVSQGEKTVGRYYTMLDPKISLQNLSDQLISDGATNIKSVVWEPVKRGD